MTKCTEPNCTTPVHARGLCNLHYRRSLKPGKLVNLCGCGERTEYTFKHGHHTRLFPSGEQARRGRRNTGDALRGGGVGYVKREQRHEHRVVMEMLLGRKLTRDEVVHHRNGDKKDNRPENLEVMTRAQHIAEHRQQMNEGRRAKSKAA